MLQRETCLVLRVQASFLTSGAGQGTEATSLSQPQGQHPAGALVRSAESLPAGAWVLNPLASVSRWFPADATSVQLARGGEVP